MTRVLIIAGSDSSGGAGIQADLKTVTMLGGYGMTAITSVTVQDTRIVHKIYDLPPAIVADQIAVVLNDIGADSIKIGMLSSAEIVEAVADKIKGYPEIPYVVDPVVLSTSGTRLLSANGVKSLKSYLLPGSIMTPNIPEAELLAGMSITTESHMAEAGRKLLQMGAKAVVVKGGHLSGERLYDVLVDKDGVHRVDYPRIDTDQTHGTGCVLASALAFFIGSGETLPRALALAGRYVHQAILAAPGLGKGHGPIGCFPCS